MSKIKNVLNILKTNPTNIDYDEIFYDGKQAFQLKISVKKLNNRCEKPTHTTSRGLIKRMKTLGGLWLRADNPSNRPQLNGFMDDKEPCTYLTIDHKILEKEKISPAQILKEVNDNT